MARLVDTAQLYGLFGYVGWGDGIVALYVGIAVDQTQVEHLINQTGYALAVFNYFLTNQLQFVAVNLDVLIGQYLCEARQHIINFDLMRFDSSARWLASFSCLLVSSSFL